MDRYSKKTLKQMTACGHFIFASKRHATEKLMYEETIANRRFRSWRAARKIGKLVITEFPDVDAIVGVADGANTLAQKVAKVASRKAKRSIPAYRTVKSEEGFALQRGKIYAAHKKWVIIDDVFTKGTNINKVASMLHAWGGQILGAAVLVNRNSEGTCYTQYPQGEVIAAVSPVVEHTIDAIPVASVIQYPMQDFSPLECPVAPDCPTEKEVFYS